MFGFGGSGIAGGGGGYYGPNHGPNYGPNHGGKKILPTLGVSIGLPFPTQQYPLSPYAPHVPNAHFGSISPNGVNLGLLNVNPLFSLQVTKSEHGEKLIKPFVNLHVTPTEGIIGSIGKIGNFFFAKKGPSQHHFHNHLHRYPPPPPPHYFDHQSSYPFENHHDHHHGHHHHPIEEIPPFLSHPPPPHLGPIIHGHEHGLPPHAFSEHPGFPPHHFYKDSGHNKDIIIDDIFTNPSLLGFRSNNISQNILSDFNYQSLYPQNDLNSLNFVKDDIRYARDYNNNNNNNQYKTNFVIQTSTQAPGTAEGSERVSFPSSRRRRDTDQVVPASLEKKESIEAEDESTELDSEGRALHAGKRQAFYQQPQYQQQQQQQQQKQCGPRAVCCRKPFKAPQQVQYNRCGVRNTNGITGRIKNPSYVDGDSEFGEWPWLVHNLKSR